MTQEDLRFQKRIRNDWAQKYRGQFELACCESVLLSEISNKVFKRRDIAKTYRLSLESSECDSVNWKKVNAAIIKRWSRSGLEWIKTQAWSGKCFEKPLT